MFELQRSSLFFEQMASAHPTVVQNVEIVYENKTALDASYHQPKHFILGLNNLLRSLLFFIEFSNQNSPDWLKEAVGAFIASNQNDYQKLRYLRNVSAHQKLVFPEESLVSGLYRIRSPRNYTLKFGFGDHNKPGQYAWDLALKDTADIFHDMLAFASITFMDLEHASIGECLGITRRWFFKLNFKTDSKRYNEVVDVYQLASSFSASLLDDVCKAYAAHLGVQFDHSFAMKLEDHNFINTLLEIDLFPGLFSEWWEDEFEPLNFGVRYNMREWRRHDSNDRFHRWAYENLTSDVSTYRATLERFAALGPKEVLEKENLGDFLSFICTNHWHYKRVFKGGLGKSTITPSDVMLLQRAGNVFLEECHKKKFCTIASSKDRLSHHIKQMIAKLDAEQAG